MDVQRRLTREELTAALAARQGLIERRRLDPAEAIRRFTPLQGQHPPAPYIALAARLDGFTRADLEAAITSGSVVKTTINRLTLHLAAAADYPAYAQLTRQPSMRKWRKQYAHLDEERVTAELSAWFREPRTNTEIRERVGAYDGVTDEAWTPVIFARTLLPLIQLPPAGHWDDPRRAGFVLDPRPRPALADAATHVLERYLGAFGPATKRDAAAWAGVAQFDLAAAWERLETVAYADGLHDLPGRPAPARRHAAAAAPARTLGPAAARLRRPRARDGARGAGAAADAERRPDGDRRRPRGGELGDPGRRAGDHAPRRALAGAARGDPGGGAADGPLLRREDRERALAGFALWANTRREPGPLGPAFP